jgi:putative transcriptional regulator
MAERRNQQVVIQSRLSRLMGEKRVRIIDIAKATGISRNMLSKLYYDRAQRVEPC